MICEILEWDIWLHEFVKEEYDEGELYITIVKTAEDAYNATKEYKGQSIDLANIVRDLIIAVGSRLNQLNNTGTKYYTMETDDGSNIYICIEMENICNVNANDWLHYIGWRQTKRELRTYFSVVLPNNEAANKLCFDTMHNEVGSKIRHLNYNNE